MPWYDVTVPVVKEFYVGDTLFRANADLIFLRPVGELLLEQAQCLMRLADEIRAQYGHTFVLADLKLAGVIPAESRRLLARFGAENPPLALALYHVGPLVRGVNALLFGAMNLLSKQRQNVGQFSTEDAATTWLEAERKRLLPRPPSG